MPTEIKKSVVLCSGGLDSSTCLAIAHSEGYECHTISFDYGQKHRSELTASERLSKNMGASSHRVVSLGLGELGGSALTDRTISVPSYTGNSEIPITYVPARNTTFLSIALGYAEIINANAIFIGVSAVDYSGYPDCRPEYIAAFQALANLATKCGVEGHPILIKTPLLHLSKSETIQLGLSLGVDYSQTVSCYQADDQGRACGQCDSCHLRRAGFLSLNIPDPTKYQ
jgi:7-cyano-7-deazaguanine synthase